MSLKTIDKNIRSITGNISKLNDLIHATGMLILNHANEHGDCTRALVLVKAMPASMRRGMLVDWIQRNSPIRVILTNDKVGMMKADAKGYTPFNLEAAAAVPFYVEQTKTGETEAKAFDSAAFDAAFASFIKRAEKQVSDGNVPEADRVAIEARLAVISALVTSTEATKASVSFVLPAANDKVSLAHPDRNPRVRAAA